MRLLVATVVLFGLISFWSECSFRSKDNRSLRQNNGAGQKPTSDVGTTADTELRTQYLTMEKEIREAARKSGLENLSDSSDIHDEIRIWVGFGIILPSSLVLSRTADVDQATFVTPRVAGNKAEFDSKGNVIYAKNILGPPKSGWEKVRGFLKEQGIGSPMRLAPVRHFTFDPDEAFIAIEARSGHSYSMAFFPVGDDETDAKKALGVCRRLQSEFPINLGCGDLGSSQ